MKKKILKNIAIFVLFLFLFGFIFIVGMNFGREGTFSLSLGSVRFSNINDQAPNGVNLSLFWEAWNNLKEKAVKDPSNEDMVNGAIAGLMSATGDPYTMFFTKTENQRFREDIGGEFNGIGVELVMKKGLLTVVAPLSDTPAEKAGLKPNDIISKVDGASASEIGFEEVINRIRGAVGTKVKLEILREGLDAPKEFEIERAKIVVKSLEWQSKSYAGKEVTYIKIRQFGDDTMGLFREAVKDAQKSKDKIIVLDLRNNPGGYLETAVEISSYFIPDGTIVREEGKGGSKKDYPARGGAVLKDYNVVLLVNEGSASASEILAGALRDRKKSKLVGEKTFGKGSVQELVDLSDGSAVKITVAKWLTPAGIQINGEGLTPDTIIGDDEANPADEQLDAALKIATE